MENSCISNKRFEEARTIHTWSKPVEVFMGSDTQMLLIHFLIHFYKIFNEDKKHQMKEEVNVFLIVLNYYINIFIEQTLEELNHT